MYRYMIGALLSCVVFADSRLNAQISYTGTLYTENFNTLASTGTSSTLPTGWAFLESGSGANTTYTASNGSLSAGDTYSFGSTNDSDRAFGMLRQGNFSSIIGAQIQNNTGSTLTEIVISYRGEQWSQGGKNRADGLLFEYSTNATSLGNGTWTSFSALNFSSPQNGNSTGTLDGNATGNFTNVSATLSGFSVLNTNSLWIRWLDQDISGTNDSLGIDDFSIRPVPEPGSVLGVSFAALGMLGLIRRKQAGIRPATV